MFVFRHILPNPAPSSAQPSAPTPTPAPASGNSAPTTPQPMLPTFTAYVAPLQPLARLITAAPTPRKLVLLFAAICVSTLAFWVVANYDIATSAQALQSIGKDAAPSIIAASRIGANLADAHANAANALLASGDTANEFWQRFDSDLDCASEQLVTAAQNITYGDEERLPIVKLLQGLRAYASLIGQARRTSSYERAAAIQDANALLHATLLPAAEKLDAANLKHLTEQYACSRSASGWEIGSSLGFGLALLLACLWTQFYLHRRFRRVLNLPLLAATVLVGWFVFSLPLMFAAVNEDLRRAKEDAFDSIYCMWKARAAACDANADQSLFVLTQYHHNDFGAAHTQRINELIGGELPEDAARTVASGGKAHFGGLLGREAQNITFPGEREALSATLRGYTDFAESWSHTRELENSDKHADAVNHCLNDTTFRQFDHGMDTLITLNQHEFDRAVEDGFASLAYLPALTGALSLSVVTLAWLGLRPRWNEYRA